ncbi:sulfate transport system substrate-binding protein [Flavimobilis soli]|uniref:Sulfate transport system substrate-binding protein n=1 Tax=Flavimobilis soli TaxID=442709 RepID=A0A2A9EE15_9MICO|nr:sulfate ABC transporter substrate-binding protein [Flavimobilis soli]PFG37164.1 sulfate transport system substrate-binding protein [Flavimobilis soli]
MTARSTRGILTLALAALTATALSACGPEPLNASTSGDAASTQLSLVGFAVPKAANDAAQAAFAKTDAGAGTTWTTSYGASGDQSRAVESGLDADYVHFSLTGDVTRLVDAGLVDESWDDGEHKGIVSDSVVVLVVREGNPKNIQGWDDLVRDDVSIVSPNPGSSGSARWNILAAYGSVLAKGGTEAEATEYLTKFFENVAALPGSGRDATTAFTSGTGDVLISYENEAILARQNGETFDYVVPAETLLIENPAAVLKDADPKAKAYLDFVLTAEGQKEFAAKGFRPLVDVGPIEVEGANDPKNPFPEPEKLLTIADDFGGWSETNAKFFGDDGLVTKIQQETGKK